MNANKIIITICLPVSIISLAVTVHQSRAMQTIRDERAMQIEKATLREKAYSEAKDKQAKPKIQATAQTPAISSQNPLNEKSFGTISPIQRATMEARALQEEGKYPEALEKYLWCIDSAQT